MSVKNTSPSSVQICKKVQSELKKIAFFTNKSQSQIIEEFVTALHDSMHKDFIQSAMTGALISYLIDCKSTTGISPIVSGTFQCDFNAPKEETDKIRNEMISQQFAQQDKEADERKPLFKEALKND